MKTILNSTRQKIKNALDKTDLYVLKETCGDDSYMRVCISMDEGDDFKSIHYCCRKYLNSTVQDLRKLNDVIEVNIDDNTLHVSINGSLRKYVKRTYKYDNVLETTNRKSFDRIFQTKHTLV